MHPCEIRDIFCDYLKAMREFLEVFERCIVRGWPDRKDAISVTTRIAYLNCDVQRWRLDYLCEQGLLELKAHQSLSAIFDRLNKQWTDDEEAALKAKHVPYRGAVTNRDVERAQLDPEALEGPFGDIERDQEYLTARESLRLKAKSLDAQLQQLMSGK